MTTTFIWLIGCFFTIGLVVDPRDKSASWLIPLCGIIWPLLLGIYVKVTINSLEKQQEAKSK